MPGVFAAIIFSAREWLVPALIAFVIGTAIFAWSYRKGPGSPALRLTCFLLKLAGFAALLACLLEPHWSETRPKPGANYLALVADNSIGMTIHDPGEETSRGDKLRTELGNEQQEWTQRLAGMFQLRRFTFDQRLQATRDFKTLSFDGRASAMATALQGVKDRFSGQPLAGIVLFTDGNATDSQGGSIDTTGMPPIYPVVVGSKEEPRDLAIQKVNVTQTAFEDAPVTIQVDARAVGYRNETIVAELWSRGLRALGTNAATATNTTTKLVQSQTAQSKGDGAVNFRFTVRPDAPGVVFYDVRLRANSAEADATKASEATLANNTQTLAVNRPEGPLRVLYLGGRPNWEYKFLNRSIMEDPQVEMVGFIRVARREPKFSFRGRAGEESNPLFRGFDGKDEETERYDQPVMIRLNAKDETELRGGFPKLAEELFGYHAIILDDIESDYFTHDQMMLVQKFVSERGGGFLMLGGVDSFHQGKYPRTPIGEMLPVYLDRIVDYQSPDYVKLEFTREGWLEPWARLRRTESEERQRLAEMPPFEVISPIREVKPGASVLVRALDDEGKAQPALIVQRFGRGRSGALMVGDMWRWAMREESGQKDLGKMWRQMVRWLVSDSPNPVEVVAEAGGADLAMNLQVRARDKKFEPMDNATVTLEVEALGALNSSNTPPEIIRLSTEPSSSEAGVYTATYVPKSTGAYRVRATVANADGMPQGMATTGFASDPMGDEFRSLTPNRALLEMIASKTGGKMIEFADVSKLAVDLPKVKAPVVENWSYPIWHQPAIFLLALACFLAEWGLRRYKGMA
ncbi:MAG TPA: glutamine amidotransferase [Methylomirabilota bacterium]|nr:glutamine amidotransferase [Methylomirabilota bacterium]